MHLSNIILVVNGYYVRYSASSFTTRSESATSAAWSNGRHHDCLFLLSLRMIWDRKIQFSTLNTLSGQFLWWPIILTEKECLFLIAYHGRTLSVFFESQLFW